METNIETPVIPPTLGDDVCICGHNAFSHKHTATYIGMGRCTVCNCKHPSYPKQPKNSIKLDSGKPEIIPMKIKTESVIGTSDYELKMVFNELGAISFGKKKGTNILGLMIAELVHADTKYHDDKMSKKEIKASLATVHCEFVELKRETKRKKKRPDLMKKEAIQHLAMSYKFCRDVIFGDE